LIEFTKVLEGLIPRESFHVRDLNRSTINQIKRKSSTTGRESYPLQAIRNQSVSRSSSPELLFETPWKRVKSLSIDKLIHDQDGFRNVSSDEFIYLINNSSVHSRKWRSRRSQRRETLERETFLEGKKNIKSQDRKGKADITLPRIRYIVYCTYISLRAVRAEQLMEFKK
jgi:hypothetical protein